MKASILLIITTLFLTGCSLFPKRTITTQTVKVQVPVLYAPAPPTLLRPDLAIHDLPVGARENYALIARHYKITVIQLLNYVEQLELVLDNYELISETLDNSSALIDDGIEITVD